MALYTDQEKWSVNHIALKVVYSMLGYSICEHKARRQLEVCGLCNTYDNYFSAYVRLCLDMVARMSKTIYN